jgi:choline dehydrogenase-like flavoprotein
MGTVRAGADPRRHPCDPWGRVRGARNVYVADTSLFPTALGVNPMVTVMALAARVADAVKAELAT